MKARIFILRRSFAFRIRSLAMTDFCMDKTTLSLALNGFTSEFGMGSGGAHLLWSPGRNWYPAAYRRTIINN
jgi:hypothetical protein